MEQKISITKDNRPNRAKPYLVRWYGEYDVRTGKKRRYCKSFKLRKEADLFAEEKKAEFQAGMPTDQKDITLSQLCHKFMTNQPKPLSKSSRRGYTETIDRLTTYFAPTVSIRRIGVEDAEGFISNLKPTDSHYISKGKALSDSTIDKHLRQAKKIFSTAKKWQYIKTNPFKNISLGTIRKEEWHYVTIPQFNAIIENTNTLRDKVLYGVLYWCGLRYGEGANLQWDGRNIDFKKSEINIYNRAGTKTLPPFNVKDYEARSVPMNKWVVEMLKKLRSERTENCPFVFLTAERLEIVKAKWQELRKEKKSGDWENRLMLNGMLRNFKARCVQAGINTNLKLNLHGLRKSWAMNLASSGKVPMKTLQELGGWSEMKTCEEFYLRSSDANRQRAADVLNELAENGKDDEN